MTAKQQWAIVAAVVAIMAGGAATASHFLADELTPVTVGSKAPIFAGATIDEKPTIKSLNDYKGEVVLLNVWATTCLPCRDEMPSIEKLYKDYQPKGLKIVAVSTDVPGMSQSIRDFAKAIRSDIRYPLRFTQQRAHAVPDFRLPVFVHHFARRHHSQEMDRARQLELTRKSQVDRPTAGRKPLIVTAEAVFSRARVCDVRTRV